MLHTKSQGHWAFGFREEDIQMGLTLYGHGGHLGQVTINICYKLNSLKESPYKILAQLA